MVPKAEAKVKAEPNTDKAKMQCWKNKISLKLVKSGYFNQVTLFLKYLAPVGRDQVQST